MTLEIITSNLLAPLRHGFFTRNGGASSGVFAGLNCGRGSSDQAEIVEINRGRVAEALGLESPAHLVSAHQVHSPRVVEISEAGQVPGEADAMVCATPGLALGVLTADCQPVLFADHQAGVIGAAHAGWRGAQAGVLEATLDAMEKLGAQRGEILAVIGPSISQRAYEVSEEFLESFLREGPDTMRFFANGAAGKYQFDMQAYSLARLRDAGVGEAVWTRHCTYASEERFFSYRRTTHAGEADYGRLISAIRL